MVELTGGIGTQQRQPGTASQPGRRRNEGSPPPGYRAGHLSFVLTLGRPPVTGSVAENRAAPDSLAHTADATQAQNRKAGPAITGGPFGGESSPSDEACSGPFRLLGTWFHRIVAVASRRQWSGARCRTS